MRPLLTRVLEVSGATFVLVATWWALSIAVGSPALPAPLAALSALARLAPSLIGHALVSLWRVSAAMALGALFGVPAGLALGRSRKADAVLGPIVFLTYPIPKVVFLPVLLVLLGLGDAPKIALIALIVFFQVLVTARDAARGVPQSSVVSVRSLGGTALDIARHVVIPASLPDVFTALRIGTGTAIAVLFLAESIAGTDGLGYYIVDAWGRIDYPAMFAGIIAMALLGLALYEALDAAETRLTRWRRAGLR